jgi:hypothetical protein
MFPPQVQDEDEIDDCGDVVGVVCEVEVAADCGLGVEGAVDVVGPVDSGSEE